MTGAGKQAVLGLTGALGLCAVALAGADYPPPPGFILLVGLIVLWTWAVCLTRWRLRTRARSRQLLATAAAGSMAGLVAWLVLWLKAFSEGNASAGIPTVIGFLVMAVAGAMGGTLVAPASWLLVDHGSRARTVGDSHGTG